MLITSAKKRGGKVIIAITSSNSILYSLFGALQGSILCSLFLLYIKSNHVVPTVKQLAADYILLFIAIC